MILQSCPRCARQFDVRHLGPGSRVRCTCDVEFTVEHLRDVRVRARRCTNCGGAVDPAVDSCPYCSAGLDAAALTGMPCPHCFAWMDEDANHCPKCGTEVAPQALPPIPAGKTCPRCRGDLRIRSLTRFSLVECCDCQGLWLDPDAFDSVCRKAERNAHPESPFGTRASAGTIESTVAYIPCLDCSELMQRRQYRHRSRPTGVVLDVCRDHGVWLDAEELERVLTAIRRAGAGPPSDATPRPSLPTRPYRPREPRETSVLEDVLSVLSYMFGG